MNPIELIKKNRDIIIIAAIVLVVLVISLISFSGKNPGETVQFVSPFSTDQSFGTGWGAVDFSGVAGDQETVELPVHSSEVFAVDEVQVIVEKLGMGTATRTVSEDGAYYSWSRGEEFVQYNSETGDLVVNMSAVSLNEITDTSFSSRVVEDYFVEFVRVYITNEQSISAVSQVQGSFFDVSGTWELDGYPTVRKYGQNYSVIARFDRSGNLVSLYASLYHFSQQDTMVEVVSLRELKSMVSFNNYPKEAYIDIVPSGDYDCGEECDPYGWDTVGGFQGAAIKDASIVYYYSPEDKSDVIPVYRLVGEGTAGVGTEIADVSVVIYASAIDPSQIIIPYEE